MLYVGNAEAHKNLEVLDKALDVLDAMGVRSLVTATVPRGQGTSSDTRIVRVGTLEPQEVRELMARADCLVMPSLAESLGLPLIEAMSVGLPVVAADRPYAREVCGGAALYFDPGDAAALAIRLESAWRDKDGTAARVACGIAQVRALKARTGWQKVGSQLMVQDGGRGARGDGFERNDEGEGRAA